MLAIINFFLECLLMDRGTWIQSHVESYQRFKKWYLILPCIIRVKSRKPEKGVAPSPTPWFSSYRKGSLQFTLDYGHQLYYFFLYLYWYLGTYIHNSERIKFIVFFLCPKIFLKLFKGGHIHFFLSSDLCLIVFSYIIIIIIIIILVHWPSG